MLSAVEVVWKGILPTAQHAVELLGSLQSMYDVVIGADKMVICPSRRCRLKEPKGKKWKKLRRRVTSKEDQQSQLTYSQDLPDTKPPNRQYIQLI